MNEGSSELGHNAIRALQLLHEQPNVTVAQLREAGVNAPAQALYELQLAGYRVERKGARWHLADASVPVPPRPEPPPRVRRVGPAED